MKSAWEKVVTLVVCESLSPNRRLNMAENGNDQAKAAQKEEDEQPTPAAIQSLIAKELTGLSSAEREKAMDDVHGISSETKEDPGFIKSCLKEMQEHLNKMKAGTSYELAESLSPEYVHDSDFRLMFIRADFYVTKAAAERMIKFFDFKKRLFGEDKLSREITLDDFDEDGMGVMKSGYAQISPYKDMSGRPIVFFVLEHKKNYQNPENLVRDNHLAIDGRSFSSLRTMPTHETIKISLLLFLLRQGLGIICLCWRRRCRRHRERASHVYTTT